MSKLTRDFTVKAYVSEPLFVRLDLLRRQKEFDDGQKLSMSNFLLFILKKHLQENN